MEEEERGAGRKKREKGILKKAQAYWVLWGQREKGEGGMRGQSDFLQEASQAEKQEQAWFFWTPCCCPFLPGGKHGGITQVGRRWNLP